MGRKPEFMKPALSILAEHNVLQIESSVHDSHRGRRSISINHLKKSVADLRECPGSHVPKPLFFSGLSQSEPGG